MLDVHKVTAATLSQALRWQLAKGATVADPAPVMLYQLTMRFAGTYAATCREFDRKQFVEACGFVYGCNV